MSEIKYRHPLDQSLTWTGRGRAPKWYEYALENGFSEADLLVENQRASGLAAAVTSGEIDLGIGDTETRNMNERLEVMAEQVNAGPVSAPVVVVAGEVSQMLPASEQENRDLLNQLLGQAQAFTAASGLLRTFGVSKLAFVKENKLYKQLNGLKLRTGSESLSGTWEEFCGLLGMSVDKVDTDIANLRAFGEESLEAMSRMGIGYRELRQFRKLPADQREALAQIATTGSKEDVLEAAYDAIEAERKKADELTVKNAELGEDLKLAERRAKNLDAECERKDMQIKRLSSSKARCTEFLERTEDIRAECLALQAEAELPLAALKKLFDEVNGEDASLPEQRVQLEHVWVTAHVVYARALSLLDHMVDNVAGEMPERINGTHIMTPAEAQRWLLDYPMIENRHAAEAANRQEKRDAAKPKGPGRPKGSTNKASEE